MNDRAAVLLEQRIELLEGMLLGFMNAMSTMLKHKPLSAQLNQMAQAWDAELKPIVDEFDVLIARVQQEVAVARAASVDDVCPACSDPEICAEQNGCHELRVPLVATAQQTEPNSGPIGA